MYSLRVSGNAFLNVFRAPHALTEHCVAHFPFCLWHSIRWLMCTNRIGMLAVYWIQIAYPATPRQGSLNYTYRIFIFLPPLLKKPLQQKMWGVPLLMFLNTKYCNRYWRNRIFYFTQGSLIERKSYRVSQIMLKGKCNSTFHRIYNVEGPGIQINAAMPNVTAIKLNYK